MIGSDSNGYLITGYSSPCLKHHLFSITHCSNQTSHTHFLSIGNAIATVDHISQANPLATKWAEKRRGHIYIR